MSQRLRAQIHHRVVRTCLLELFKWGATLLLLLTLSPRRGVWLLRLRWGISRGLFSASGPAPEIVMVFIPAFRSLSRRRGCTGVYGKGTPDGKPVRRPFILSLPRGQKRYFSCLTLFTSRKISCQASSPKVVPTTSITLPAVMAPIVPH